MDVGKFAKAYVGQKQIDYKYMGNNYGNPDALNYVTCTAVQYNDAYVSFLSCIDVAVVVLSICHCHVPNTYTD